MRELRVTDLTPGLHFCLTQHNLVKLQQVQKAAASLHWYISELTLKM